MDVQSKLADAMLNEVRAHDRYIEACRTSSIPAMRAALVEWARAHRDRRALE